LALLEEEIISDVGIATLIDFGTADSEAVPLEVELLVALTPLLQDGSATDAARAAAARTAARQLILSISSPYRMKSARRPRSRILYSRDFAENGRPFRCGL
jgi:hypothetical protein